MDLFKSKEIRKEQSIKKLELYGIDYIDNLPFTYSASEVTMKSKEEIAKRYIASIVTIQVAYDIVDNKDIDASIKFFDDLLSRYESKDCLNDLEKKVFSNEATEKDLFNITWQYECLNVLSWVLGFQEKLSFPSGQCNVNHLVEIIINCRNFSEFFNNCNLIDIEDVLDELDLEYRYHWATDEKRINPATSIGELDSEVIIERR